MQQIFLTLFYINIAILLLSRAKLKPFLSLALVVSLILATRSYQVLPIYYLYDLNFLLALFALPFVRTFIENFANGKESVLSLAKIFIDMGDSDNKIVNLFSKWFFPFSSIPMLYFFCVSGVNYFSYLQFFYPLIILSLIFYLIYLLKNHKFNVIKILREKEFLFYMTLFTVLSIVYTYVDQVIGLAALIFVIIGFLRYKTNVNSVKIDMYSTGSGVFYFLLLCVLLGYIAHYGYVEMFSDFVMNVTGAYYPYLYIAFSVISFFVGIFFGDLFFSISTYLIFKYIGEMYFFDFRTVLVFCYLFYFIGDLVYKRYLYGRRFIWKEKLF
ncbi:hypothetical protein Thena_0350 [Thermodesulfobium narugense DSM 14796]|uniref:Uncharacterized protein n=1 Tax=Thermodesulfobium narugense DSM 14796 TaxID=747365 RepID=M1E539_9BACT|nr:hypothetical protein [Thermodesulfobium narugense]AEE13996.1 hypothetical protein Thena_0350 [Thermodesulfobium narugense DSM 14796]